MKRSAFVLALLLSAATAPAALAQPTREADSILAAAARESGRPSYAPERAVRFRASDNVFVKSALAVDFTPRNATVTLPMYRGLAPDGALDPISIVCKVISANGRPTVKLSDNPTKAMGPRAEIERYKRVFEVGVQTAQPVLV